MKSLHITYKQQRMNHLHCYTAVFQSCCNLLCLITATAKKYDVKAIRVDFCCFMENKRCCNIEACSQQCCRCRRRRRRRRRCLHLRRRRGCYNY